MLLKNAPVVAPVGGPMFRAPLEAPAADRTLEVAVADACRIPLPDKVVQSCATSPPYWGLRQYGGGDVQLRDWPAVTFRPACGLPDLTVPAWRGALGAEPDPWMFVGHLVLVFREVHRVLRDDGTLWLNLGPTVADAKAGGGFKRKDLIQIPHFVANAMQGDGWMLRDDLQWHKASPMRGAINDRTVRAHEPIFLFSKGPRYYFDHHAIQEPSKYQPPKVPEGFRAMSNATSVQTWSNTRLTEAHFAAFCLSLPRFSFKASTSAGGCCPECRTPFRRVVEKQRIPTRPGADSKTVRASNGAADHRAVGDVVGNRDPKRHVTVVKTLGWEPTCRCEAASRGERRPCLVMDNFCGAGTSMLAADDLGLDFLGVEVNPGYAEMARRRLATHRQKRPTTPSSTPARRRSGVRAAKKYRRVSVVFVRFGPSRGKWNTGAHARGLRPSLAWWGSCLPPPPTPPQVVPIPPAAPPAVPPRTPRLRTFGRPTGSRALPPTRARSTPPSTASGPPTSWAVAFR